MKKTKLYTLLFALLFSFNGIAQEQEGGQVEQNLNQLKQEYIQTKLELSENEINAFAKLYEQYETERKALRQKTKADRRSLQEKKHLRYEEIAELSEEEAMELLEGRLKRQEEMLKLERKYIEQFTKTISAKQVLQYKQAEREFRKELLRAAMEERREGAQNVNERMKRRMKRMKELKRQEEMKQ